MTIPENWIRPATLRDATVAQREIAAACMREDRPASSSAIAGADTSMAWRDSVGPIHAAIAPIEGPAVQVTELPRFAYIPGYLGFREVPALVSAWGKLAEKPGLILMDGHGLSHPRRCGVATHLGVVLDVPAIGIAKTRLCGAHDEVGPEVGDRVPLIDRGEVVGMVLRTSRRGHPIFVSIGHRVSLDTAVDWALRLSGGRRLPLPIRLAHEAANAQRRAYQSRES